ncbi:MAG: flavodoxin domain-containing protein [bacterium]|nr:flavodoxin domain-containing protein [bacterium]
MKKIVVYKSGTGFTKKYAEWIAERCGCKAVALGKVSERELNEQDVVIYGGWIMGNMITGLNKIKKVNPKNLILFAVGSTPDSDNIRTAIQEQNQIQEYPFYYFEGGFRFEQLSFPKKTMLKMVRNSVAKKENKTEQDEYMAKVIGTTFDHSDKKYIEALVSKVNRIK